MNLKAKKNKAQITKSCKCNDKFPRQEINQTNGARIQKFKITAKIKSGEKQKL